jgi:hypothetical protein
MHGLTVLLLSACAALLGLCSGAELRGEVLRLAAQPSAAVCGEWAAPANWVDGNGHPVGFQAFKVLECTKNESLVIVQSPQESDDPAMYFWVVNEVVNGCKLLHMENTVNNNCYIKECFSVQREAPCPPCFGKWKQRYMKTPNWRGDSQCKRE